MKGPWTSHHYVAALLTLMLSLWLLGLHVADVARAIAAVTALLLLIKPLRERAFASEPFFPPRAFTRLVRVFCIAYCALIPVYLISKVYAGTHGIDFAIFSQVIANAWPRGNFESSLISPSVVNFLGHHFVPILSLPGLFGFLGVPAYVSGSLVHGLGVLAGALGFHRLARVVRIPSHLSLFLTLVILINPSIRHTLFWGIHDETFAFGILPWIFVCWLQGRHWWAFFLIAVTFLTKESMFLFAAMFAVMAMTCGYLGIKPLARRDWAPYLLTLVVSLAGFATYFFLQPYILGKTFDHFNKVGSLDYLLDPKTLYEKGLWLGYLFLPFLFVPLWRPKTILYLLPGSPFVGIVLISGFADMHQLNNYYSAIPSFLIGIASLLALASFEPQRERLLGPGTALLLVALAFSFASNKPTKDLALNLSGTFYDASDLEFIPDESTVVATPAAALFLLRCKNVQRSWIANRFLPEYDFIAVKRDERTEVSDALIGNATVCKTTDRWIVWCRNR